MDNNNPGWTLPRRLVPLSLLLWSSGAAALDVDTTIYVAGTRTSTLGSLRAYSTDSPSVVSAAIFPTASGGFSGVAVDPVAELIFACELSGTTVQVYDATNLTAINYLDFTVSACGALEIDPFRRILYVGGVDAYSINDHQLSQGSSPYGTLLSRSSTSGSSCASGGDANQLVRDPVRNLLWCYDSEGSSTNKAIVYWDTSQHDQTAFAWGSSVSTGATGVQDGAIALDASTGDLFVQRDSSQVRRYDSVSAFPTLTQLTNYSYRSTATLGDTAGLHYVPSLDALVDTTDSPTTCVYDISGGTYACDSIPVGSVGAVDFYPLDLAEADDDGDGLPDSVEIGAIGISNAALSGYNDADPSTTTDPSNPDTDGDGLDDGEEDRNHDGAVGSTETDPSDPDTDNDGLNDGAEVNTYGTDPFNDDTDNDGLTDGDEVNTTGTDPLDDDTDDDGLSDADEVNSTGTDPLAADTDNDGLTDSQELNTLRTDPLDPDSDNDGLIDGREVNTTTTDPNDADSDNDGLSDGAEVNITTDPNDPDTDGGGSSDGQEVLVFGTDPLDPSDDVLDFTDTDGDGLVDSVEIALGTDPDDADSDNDGLTDGEEINTTHTDPLDPDTDGGGVSDGDEVLVNGTDPLDASDDISGATDSDLDGLSDDAERALGTDPQDPDTDDDGLNDGEEVNTTHTDPLNPDTDDDGLNDGEEVNTYDTDPLDPDTDDDGLNDGEEVSEGTDPLNPTHDTGSPDTTDNGQVSVPACTCQGRSFFEPKWSLLLLGLVAFRRRA